MNRRLEFRHVLFGSYAAAAAGPDHAGFAAGVDALVRGLEQQLAQWREVKTLADAKAGAAD
ncbi:hypothetical protein I8J29_30715 [Paenibacillus sp. MWE-103]|uniref:Uncharacterized protein n=1 Tax=Paenibacillus artemisiicola TaxID=1172618 RepID=A0ABS3WJS5_9BACL|nr:hypothetical protein [Paenibacillus artemisiicola]MBO7748557.1 hypothetical protein [Paenibacillus artemisiicola]